MQQEWRDLKIPTRPIELMIKIYRDVIPITHKFLSEWKTKAKEIPDEELRKQALMSIDSKTFHCEGGSIYGMLAGPHMKESIRFIVAYQTISDYLDNLCDRSTSLDPKDFRLLHDSMHDALTPGKPVTNYYANRKEQNDGGYLVSLVKACQDVLGQLPHYKKIAPVLHELAGYYCDLQVHKHVEVRERVPRLKAWFEDHKNQLPEMTWYEFSASAGSTLGIFCLVSYAFDKDFKEDQVIPIRKGLFPYVQGLHILLDYFIDQDEDRSGGDLNFCFYYPDYNHLVKRFGHFVKQADLYIEGLPDEKFHKMINRGLLGIYLSDHKVKQQEKVHTLAKRIIKYGGLSSQFFYMNGKIYRKTMRKVYG